MPRSDNKHLEYSEFKAQDSRLTVHNDNTHLQLSLSAYKKSYQLNKTIDPLLIFSHLKCTFTSNTSKALVTASMDATDIDKVRSNLRTETYKWHKGKVLRILFHSTRHSFTLRSLDPTHNWVREKNFCPHYKFKPSSSLQLTYFNES